MEYKKTNLLVKEVTKELNNKGVRISDKGVKLVVDCYLEMKKMSLEEGYSIIEDGIGDLVPTVRRCNTFTEGQTSITTKLTMRVSSDLRSKITGNMLNSEEIYRRLGGTKLEKEEYNRFAKEYNDAK